MRKLLGNTQKNEKSESKPEPLKSWGEPAPDPKYGALGREEPTLSERLKQAEEPAPEQIEPAEAEVEEKLELTDDPRYSVVGQAMVLKGELEAAEDLEIAGRLEGSVKHTASRLIVAPSGVVKATIEAVNLIVEGRVEGDITCRESVVLKDSADVTGNIRTARINIVDGARFNGQVVMSEAKAG